jgi:hypothetical protein
VIVWDRHVRTYAGVLTIAVIVDRITVQILMIRRAGCATSSIRSSRRKGHNDWRAGR